MTLCLKTSRDFDCLCEISFIWDLHNVSPAALEVLSEDWRDVLDFGGARRRWSLVLWLSWNCFISSLSDELTADRLTLNGTIKSTEDATAVAELP